VSDSIRRRAWPLLVGLYTGTTPDTENQEDQASTCSRSSSATSLTSPAAQTKAETCPNLSKQCSRSGDSGRSTSDNSNSASSSSLHAHEHVHESKLSDEDETIATARKNQTPSSWTKWDAQLCADAAQVERDVVRCTHHLLRIANTDQLTAEQENELCVKQKALFQLLNRVLLGSSSSPLSSCGANNKDKRSGTELNNNDRLHYYQGYHEVGSIVLSTLQHAMKDDSIISKPTTNSTDQQQSQQDNLSSAAAVLHQLSYSHLRDCLASDFAQLQTALHLTVLPLLAKLDPDVWQHFDSCQMEPFFCLSWVITWFSRDLPETALVQRLFDFFMVGHALLPVYVSLAMVLHPVHRELVLATEPGDFSSLHRRLRQLPMNCCETTSRPIGLNGKEKTESDDDFFQSDAAASVYVPIQDILDLTLEFMRLIPPRELIYGLAPRYFDPKAAEEMLLRCGYIQLLNNEPVEWAVSATAGTNSSINKIDLKKYIRKNENSTPVIALGFAIGVMEARRRRKRQKRLLMVVVAAVLVILIVVTVIAAGIQLQLQQHTQMQRVLDTNSKQLSTDSTGAPTPSSSMREFSYFAADEKQMESAGLPGVCTAVSVDHKEAGVCTALVESAEASFVQQERLVADDEGNENIINHVLSLDPSPPSQRIISTAISLSMEGDTLSYSTSDSN